MKKENIRKALVTISMVGLLLSIGFSLMGCGTKKEQPEEAKTKVEVEAVSEQDTTEVSSEEEVQ